MNELSANKGYMPHLDGVRALAVTGVVIEHWSSGLPKPIRTVISSVDLGGLGVECFFVLSGFLITLLLLKSKDSETSFSTKIGHFYVRRILRIFPAYYAALLVFGLIFEDMRAFVPWHSLYLSNVYPVFHKEWPRAGGHFWSLSVEEQFYLFWPFIVLTLSTKRIIFVGFFACVIAVLSRIIVSQYLEGPAWVTLTTSCLDLLCFGAILACLKHTRQLEPDAYLSGVLRVLGIAALGGYVVFYYLLDQAELLKWLGRSLTALFFGYIVVSAANGLRGALGLLFFNKQLIWIGTISYGLYIYHPFVPHLYSLFLDVAELDKGVFGAYYIRFPLLAVMLLAITSFSYYAIERPIRDFKKYFG